MQQKRHPSACPKISWYYNHLDLQSAISSQNRPLEKKGPPELAQLGTVCGCGAQQANVYRICNRGNTTLLVPKPPNVTINST